MHPDGRRFWERQEHEAFERGGKGQGNERQGNQGGRREEVQSPEDGKFDYERLKTRES